MWLLKFFPDWIFYGILIVGACGIPLSRFVPMMYRSAVQALSAGLFIIGVFMAGAIHDNTAWLDRVKDLQLKLKDLEIASQQENIQIEEKIIEKTKIVKERGQDVIKYIDREVVKYDESCKLPKEFVDALNKAAEQPK
jgi:hypothetical protein